MARKVQVLLVDDLDGTELGEDGGNTVQFGLDGTTYEIDLSAANMELFHKDISRYVEAARRVGRSGTGGSARRANRQASNAAAPKGANGHDPKAIRAWAVEKGLLKADSKGRIPGHIVERFEAEAH